MAQMGFFDLSDRYASLDANRDLWSRLTLRWDGFRLNLALVWPNRQQPDQPKTTTSEPEDAPESQHSIYKVGLCTIFSYLNDQVITTLSFT